MVDTEKPHLSCLDLAYIPNSALYTISKELHCLGVYDSFAMICPAIMARNSNL